MNPQNIEQFVLPYVDLSWCSDIEKVVILTAMYDYNGDNCREDFEYAIPIIKKHRGPSPLRLAEPPYLGIELSEYFKGYPFYYHVTDKQRFEHTWICAGHGSGKTTLLENFIFDDLEKVKEGRATVVVMDSQGRHELLGRIEQGFPCTMIDSSTPMNIFARPRRAQSAREAEIMYTSQIDLITYVFSATLGDGGNFTPKQRTLWTYMVQLVMEAEGTVLDMLKLLLPKGLDGYRQVVSKLPPQGQLFFNTQFDDPKQYVDTKKELHWRLDAILQKPSFARIFTQRRSLDFYSLLQKPQCILVDTDKALLGQGGTEIFGRFIIAMLLSVSQQRGNIPSHLRLPTYVHIDECADYIATDKNIAHIIDQARKMRMAFTFAHQREGQITEPNVLDALRHCGIRLAKDKSDSRLQHTAQPYAFRVNESFNIVTSPPVKRPALKRPSVPATTVAAFVHEGEVMPPEPPRGLPSPQWGEDDIDQTPR